MDKAAAQKSGELLWEVSARADMISRASSSLLWLAVTTPSVSLEKHWFSKTKKFKDFTSFLGKELTQQRS